MHRCGAARVCTRQQRPASADNGRQPLGGHAPLGQVHTRARMPIGKQGELPVVVDRKERNDAVARRKAENERAPAVYTSHYRKTEREREGERAQLSLIRELRALQHVLAACAALQLAQPNGSSGGGGEGGERGEGVSVVTRTSAATYI